ncbi:hypothetical protein HZS_7102 [Henneguya salminicola]|nr:hypothetical protein HZS_7102 [Henneguya salminicola]
MRVKKNILFSNCFSSNFRNDMAIEETTIFGDKTRKETILNLFLFCMELCCQNVVQKGGLINGVAHAVEIGKAKFGKIKYDHTFLTEGVCILGGIFTETDECFLVPCSNLVISDNE